MSQIIDRVYHINSRDRVPPSPSASDFYVNFIEPISPIYPNQKIAVAQTTIPLSYYQINSTNNVVFVTELKSSVSSQFSINIPYGNGNATTLLTEIATQLSTASPNGLTYVLNLNSTTGKITFSFTGTATSVTYNSTYDYFTADDLLGFYDIVDAVVPSGGSYLGGIVNFSGLADATVQVRLTNMVASSIFTTETGNTSTILSQVPIGQGYAFDIISYEPQHLEGSDFTSPLQQLHFQITDVRSLVIDFNGKNIQFDLVLYH
jgi:hypothetical protein